MNAKFQVPNTKWEYITFSTSQQKRTDNNEPSLLTVLHHTGTLGSNGKGYGGQSGMLSNKDTIHFSYLLSLHYSLEEGWIWNSPAIS